MLSRIFVLWLSAAHIPGAENVITNKKKLQRCIAES